MSGRRGELSFSSIFAGDPLECTMGKTLSLLVLIDEQLSPVGGGRSSDDQRRPHPLRKTSSSADRCSAKTFSCREGKEETKVASDIEGKSNGAR